MTVMQVLTFIGECYGTCLKLADVMLQLDHAIAGCLTPEQEGTILQLFFKQ